MKKGPGDIFQKETKYYRGKLSGGPLLWHAKPETYKDYPSSPSINLDPPEERGGRPLWEAIKERRSVRNFSGEPMEKTHLSQLLWASQGITAEYSGYELRTAPSAGALYPVETYLSVQNVEGIKPGLYHYGVLHHELRQLQLGNFGSPLAQAALDQEFMTKAGVVFIWTGIFERSKWKYNQRAYRYVYLDAGHIAQNVALAAVALGLGSCPIGALYDEEVNSILETEGEQESILYMTAIGRPF
ncbi:MAG: SagB/ThcOx family dehydrogenase [Candidatus Aminicenantes bacterium]|nr:SagB/ThcOx family dehydrogenase [Candidatus Aminicenantes bacterium]